MDVRSVTEREMMGFSQETKSHWQPGGQGGLVFRETIRQSQSLDSSVTAKMSCS